MQTLLMLITTPSVLIISVLMYNYLCLCINGRVTYHAIMFSFFVQISFSLLYIPKTTRLINSEINLK